MTTAALPTTLPIPHDGAGDIEHWLKSRGVTEVECMIPDIAGIPRGKILPTRKFLSTLAGGALRLPESVYGQLVTGDMADSPVISETEPDITLVPDPTSIRIVPWYEEPTAQVICDAIYHDGAPVTLASRHVLRRVLNFYAAQGWEPVIAPELEFFLAKTNPDPDYPLEPPVGRSGRPESGRQSYGIDVVNEFDPLFEDMYDFCDAQGIDIDTLTHESGIAQVEINFNHGEALALADQVFLFKRTVRQAALKHGVYATFMAKPYEHEPGSAMHIHQNVIDVRTGCNLFADPQTNADSSQFHAHIAGMQKHMPAAMALFAPYVNSYRRVLKYFSAPINTHWGHENRTVGLRVPHSGPAARRVENRVPGADANPYLAIAASLACGYLGILQGLTPTMPVGGSAYELESYALPRHLLHALDLMRQSDALHEILGRDFVSLFLDVKGEEHDAYQQVISPWEREHLLLNV
ncbi:MAG: glutamine synthetase family protein [Alphaproteobacteria bacterium]